jgi:O-methyltransferase
MLKKIVKHLIRRAGYEVVQRHDIGDERFEQIYTTCKPYTMTTYEKLLGMYLAIRYLVTNHIEGDVVECGVWKGGSMMATTMALTGLSDTKRTIYLYDTYEGMAEPTEKDIDSQTGVGAREFWKKKKTEHGSQWCYSPLDEVKANMARTEYPADRLVFVKGKVEDTIPGSLPAQIAMLRLDTDWYESTYHELVHLFPRLVRGGVLVLDDYWCWQGSREAVDQYFREQKIPILLTRCGQGGAIGLKTTD